MGDILDSLFSVLPFALGVIWFLKRVKRQQGKNPKQSREEALRRAVEAAGEENLSGVDTGAEAGTVHPAKSGGPSSGIDVSGDGFAEAGPALMGKDSLAGDNVFVSGASINHPAAENLQPVNISKAKAADTANTPRMKHTPGSGSRPVDEKGKTESSESVQENFEPAASRTIDRLAKLPPVAQGMAWSFILDEPVGLKR